MRPNTVVVGPPDVISESLLARVQPLVHPRCAAPLSFAFPFNYN